MDLKTKSVLPTLSNASMVSSSEALETAFLCCLEADSIWQSFNAKCLHDSISLLSDKKKIAYQQIVKKKTKIVYLVCRTGWLILQFESNYQTFLLTCFPTSLLIVVLQINLILNARSRNFNVSRQSEYYSVSSYFFARGLDRLFCFGWAMSMETHIYILENRLIFVCQFCSDLPWKSSTFWYFMWFVIPKCMGFSGNLTFEHNT